MALTKCFDCEKEISDVAWTCVHCGRPAQMVQRLTGVSVFWAVFFAILLAGAMPFLIIAVLGSGMMSTF